MKEINLKVKMFRLMGMMMNHGIPLFEIFDNITREIPDPSIKEALAGIKDELMVGLEMGPAAAKFPDVFSPLACALISGGERGGHLETVFIDLGAPGSPPLSDCTPDTFPVFKAFGVCLQSGVPVLNALELLAGETQGTKWEPAFKEIAADISQGGDLGPAVEKFPELFPAYAMMLIKCGDANGMLDLPLNLLGELQDKGIPLVPEDNPSTGDAVRRFVYLFGKALDFGAPFKDALPALIESETHPRLKSYMQEVLGELEKFRDGKDKTRMMADIMPDYPDLFSISAAAIISWAEKAGSIPRAFETVYNGMAEGLFFPEALQT